MKAHIADPVSAKARLEDWHTRHSAVLGGASFPDGQLLDGLLAGLASSPYLNRLIEHRPGSLAAAFSKSPETTILAATKAARAAGALSVADGMVQLRQAKADMHLAVTLADLSGILSLNEVTAALSDFADEATQAALAIASQDLFGAAVPGFFILAMGKHGARELNYSSDIDLTAFFDRDALPASLQDDAQKHMVKLIALVARILEEVTGDGYVFRVDLRLRPDPGSTKPAVSTQAAESYYESFGQNWERAVFIKARAVAGDRAAAAAFLDGLQPFIWRKHLDFAAIADVQSIMAQIHSHGRHGGLDEIGFDVKLGKGGIRAIEFFVQTQQLILGGRDRTLRCMRTDEGLAALCSAGRISQEVVSDLGKAYQFLRIVEHRIQMLEDAQTHRVPADQPTRGKVAALAGYQSTEALDANLLATRKTVLQRVSELFPESGSLASSSGSLVFTGVEDDPETLATLASMGFKNAHGVAETVRGWHFGRVRATRTPRARELLTALTPTLLTHLAATGDADAAFVRFSSFFAGLSAGVQLLSLFQAENGLLRDTIDILALAPRFGDLLARQPALIDSMIEPQFTRSLAEEDRSARQAVINKALIGATGFEDALDRVRRAHREEAFRIAFQTLLGRIEASVAGEAFADLAESIIAALLPVAIAEVERNHGRLECQWAVCGWGKLGGRELSATSDLDLMVVYKPLVDVSTGQRPLDAETFATRVTQRLIAALSAPTAEGGLYEVDMQLRPSGRAGPVAVRLSSFGPYYDRDAWVWERMALTRLRAVAGDASLMAGIEALRCAVLTRGLDPATIRNDAADMRERMARERPGTGLWDLKLDAGGLVDLEFVVQALILLFAPTHPNIVKTNTLDAVESLVASGILDRETGVRLSAAGRLLSDLRQMLALAVAEPFDPKTAPDGFRKRLQAIGNAPDFSNLEAQIRDAKALILSLRICHLGNATGSPPAVV